ncbi:hypothetical protein HDU92_001991 [Lobulomyces angularis]|nr:hypothetical protein HDU92_001991 [Lobulomyces angularis]
MSHPNYKNVEVNQLTIEQQRQLLLSISPQQHPQLPITTTLNPSAAFQQHFNASQYSPVNINQLQASFNQISQPTTSLLNLQPPLLNFNQQSPVVNNLNSNYLMPQINLMSQQQPQYPQQLQQQLLMQQQNPNIRNNQNYQQQVLPNQNLPKPSIPVVPNYSMGNSPQQRHSPHTMNSTYHRGAGLPGSQANLNMQQAYYMQQQQNRNISYQAGNQVRTNSTGSRTPISGGAPPRLSGTPISKPVGPFRTAEEIKHHEEIKLKIKNSLIADQQRTIQQKQHLSAAFENIEDAKMKLLSFHIFNYPHQNPQRKTKRVETDDGKVTEELIDEFEGIKLKTKSLYERFFNLNMVNFEELNMKRLNEKIFKEGEALFEQERLKEKAALNFQQ